MRNAGKLVVAVAVGVLAGSGPAAAQANPVLTHLGHVREAFRGTPEGKGLLPTALAEAAVVTRHAELASRSGANLDALKAHAGHIVHAIEPAEGMTGPGLGYGLKKAAAAVATHVDLAAQSEGAPDGVRTHAGHVAASAANTVSRADQILALAKRVQAAGSVEEAAGLVEQLNALAQQLLPGVDANGDGRIGWQDGEGGLQHVEQHVNLLAQAVSGGPGHDASF